MANADFRYEIKCEANGHPSSVGTLKSFWGKDGWTSSFDSFLELLNRLNVVHINLTF